MSVMLIVVILTALFFDFSNGQHDASGAVGPVVATRIMRPWPAIIMCSFFNFIAFFVYGLHVAGTIGGGLVVASSITLPVIWATLVSAILWNIITLKFGIPSSSSHALVGSLIGAVLISSGPHDIKWLGLLPIIIAIFISPMLGMIVSLIVSFLLSWFLRKAHYMWINKYSRIFQIISCASMSLAHGGNDAQKTMGIIFLALISEHIVPSNGHIPLWVVLCCQSAMALGMLCGGRAILHTMGSGITKLQPWQGFTAQTSASMVLSLATSLGIPVSSTHTITGALAGVGSSRSLGFVRWKMLRRIFISWLITLPLSALFAMIITIIVNVTYLAMNNGVLRDDR